MCQLILYLKGHSRIISENVSEITQLNSLNYDHIHSSKRIDTSEINNGHAGTDNGHTKRSLETMHP